MATSNESIPSFQASDGTPLAERRRVTFRVTEEAYEILKYRAMRRGVSIQDYIVYALDKVIAIEMGEYEPSDILTLRVNQLLDSQVNVEKTLDSLESVVINGFKELISLTRGDNYLLEDEDGAL